MPLYEHIYIARPDISTAQVEGLTETWSQIIKDGGGAVRKHEYWGLKTLQYKIKKNRKGHYTLLHFDAPADAIHEMERQMRINEDVMRYMTLKMDALDPEPSAILAKRDRGGRGRDRGDRFGRDRGDRGGRGDRDRGDRGDRGDRARAAGGDR